MLTTISTAARELGCSPEHISRMIKSVWWPFYRLGLEAMRVDPDEVKSLRRLIADGEKVRGKK